MRGKAERIPERSRVPAEETWDLASLFADDAQWETAFRKYERRIESYKKFRGRLGENAGMLAACLRFDADIDRAAERLAAYAYLKAAEDQANSAYQRMLGRFQTAATNAGRLASFIRPELLAIPSDTMQAYLASSELKAFRILLERLLRYAPHTLSDAEERLLAMQADMASAVGRSFRQLHDADMKFGTIADESGRKIELTNESFARLLQSPRRDVRRKAFHQYYDRFLAHEHVLASLLHGSVQADAYYAKARGYAGALDQALFADNVPRAVYDGLIEAVHSRLPALHRYYELRRRKMRLAKIHHYDTYVPILSELKARRSWDEAVESVLDATRPLGDEYVRVLGGGLRARWCDRYPNRGKQSGAFSYGTYDGDPYILMNYKPDVFDDVFTLAHEAGHSMHSYFSARHQPFPYYGYTIFVAEVASTFNEQLLSAHLRSQAGDERERAYLLNREIDDIRKTLFRQTMFAEFERVIHAMVESGEPLTIDALTATYRGLLERYFGPGFTLDDALSRECLRIPHFYRAFYVYKYATGMSAAIALAQRVREGGPAERRAYLGFLKGGCSKYPLDLLRDAGVDMSRREPILAALDHFARLVDELDGLI
ncbi:MAG: oligoendopeptidase F [Planctomycetes bacterium]|nr:oligoendopeptidase F [Planctomycetota bacterium]